MRHPLTATPIRDYWKPVTLHYRSVVELPPLPAQPLAVFLKALEINIRWVWVSLVLQMEAK